MALVGGKIQIRTIYHLQNNNDSGMDNGGNNDGGDSGNNGDSGTPDNGE